LVRPTPRSTLFPYTTLFRSSKTCKLGYSHSDPSGSFKMPAGLDIIWQKVAVENDVRVLQPLLYSPPIPVLRDISYQLVGLGETTDRKSTRLKLQSRSDLVCR